MAAISQTFNFIASSVYKADSKAGARYSQGVGIDFRLRNPNGLFYFHGFELSANRLVLTLYSTLRRGGGLGNRGFNDKFNSGGYIVASQASRNISFYVSQSSPIYSSNSLILDLSSQSNDVADFINGFESGVAAALELRDEPPPYQFDPLIGWAAEISNIGLSRSPFLVWSGEGDLRLSGKVYKGTTFNGGALFGVEQSPVQVGDPSARAKIVIAVPNAAIRDMLNIDIGPVWVEAFNIISNDNGATWKRLATGLAGRLSRPNFDVEGSIYSVEVETYSGDADRGLPKVWSDEAHRSDYPQDLGMEFMRDYESGVDIKWPP